MYVTVVQNISASTWSVSSLCDSLKHLNLHQIDPFLSQNLLITCYSTLYEKRTLFICIHRYEIDIGPITYLIGACWRQIPIAVLSHMHIYLAHHEKLIQYTSKFLSLILNKNIKKNLTIKSITSDLLPTTPICTLIGSRSTHCFLNSSLTSKHQLCTYSISPIPLWLFNGTTNPIIHSTINLLVCFPLGDEHSITF